MKIDNVLNKFTAKTGDIYYTIDTYIVYDSGKRFRISRTFIKKWVYDSLGGK